MHSESHGSHVCHKCGWPFPNPHPSAKHRRAHKKVCGKVQGFMLPGFEEKTPFAEPNEGQLSDEDHMEEKGSGGIRRQVSNRSEEEEFSDAVSEFADTGTSATMDGTVSGAVSVGTDSKATSTTNVIHHALQSIADKLDTDVQFQRRSSGSAMGSMAGSMLDKSAEPFSVELTKEVNNSANIITPVKHEGPENAHLENILSGIDVIGHNRDMQREISFDGSLSARATSPSKTMKAVSGTCVKLQTMDGFTGKVISSDVTDASTAILIDTKPLDEVMDSEKETDSVGQKMSPNEFSHYTCSHFTEVEAVKCTGASVNTAQPEVGCKVDIVCSDDNSEDCIVKEVNKNLPALSEPAAVPLEDFNEMTDKDCKGPEPVKSELSVSPDCGEATGEMEVNNTAQHDNCSRSIEVEAVDHMGAYAITAQPEVDCAHKVDIDCPYDNIEGCIAKTVNINLPALSEPADTPSEELSEKTIKDSKDLEPVKSELSATPDCGEATREIEIKNPAQHDNGSHTVGVEQMGVSMDTAQHEVDCACKVDSDCPDNNIEVCIAKEVNKTLTALSEPADMPSEELSEMIVKDSKELKPVKSELSVTSDCGEAEREIERKNPAQGDNCSHTVEVEAVEHMVVCVGTAQHEVDCANKVDVDCPDENVEGCIAKEVNKNLPTFSKPADMPSEELSEMTVNDCKDPEPVKSELSVTPDCSEATRETEVKIPVSEGIHLGYLPIKLGDSVTISSSSTQVHEENPQILGGKGVVEQISIDSVTDISKSKDTSVDGLESPVLEAIDAVSSQDDAHENDKIGNFDNNFGEENFGTNRMVAPEDANFFPEFAGNLKEAKSVPLDTIVDSSGMVINTSSVETVTEPLSDPKVFCGENFPGSSKELESSKSIDTSVSKSEVLVASVGADSMVAEAHHEETKLNHSSVVQLLESDAEDPVQSMSSAVDIASCVLGSGSIEENSIGSFVEGYASDIHSKSLDEGDNNLLKQQPDGSEVVPPDVSVDSISQTDSVEGCWGSVSDGRVPSLRDVTDAPPPVVTETLPEAKAQTPKEEAQVVELKKMRGATEDRLTANSDVFEAPSFMTLVEPGRGGYKQSASSEIQAVQNPQQAHSSYVQAGWFPSLNHVTNESQGRKKNEKIIAKVANWSTGKSHTPLKSLLVEANHESKQKAAVAQDHPKTTPNRDDANFPPDNILPNKKMEPEVSTSHASNKHIEKEWNSPARLPNSGVKRKQKYWVPFVCCSSVN